MHQQEVVHADARRLVQVIRPDERLGEDPVAEALVFFDRKPMAVRQRNRVARARPSVESHVVPMVYSRMRMKRVCY
jgi:hypothetical protein